MLRPGLALLSILLAVPASAGSRFHGGGFHGEGFHGGGFHDGGAFAFHHRSGRARGLFAIYGYGYNCGFGLDCGVYDPGYPYGGYESGASYGGYESGAGNAVSSGGGFGNSSGGYTPDPVGAEIPPVNFPAQCWVRRAGYDPSGASLGQVLVDLCHPSDRMIVTRVDARFKPPSTGKGAGEPNAADRSGAPQSPR